MSKITVAVELPAIDGFAEVGIAVGTDKGLPEKRKLRVLKEGTMAEKIMYSAASAKLIENTEVTNLVVEAAVAVVKYKLYRLEKGAKAETPIPDCDIIIDNVPDARIVTQANDKAFQTEVKNILLAERDQDALTVIVASKITFWQSNHHTGGGKLAHYVKKVYDIKYKGAVGDTGISSDRATADVHMVAHWASTCYVLNKVGFKKVREPEAYPGEEGADFHISEDVKIRTSVFPAGHAKHGACQEALKRLARVALFGALPSASDCISFLNECRAIKESEAEYHMGAQYLSESGEAKKMGVPKIIWRMAKFVRAFYPKTKLSEAAAFSLENIATYEDVFPSWETICNAMAATQLDQEVDLAVFGAVSTVGANKDALENILGQLDLKVTEELKMTLNNIADARREEKPYPLN
uniref:Putative nucleocapsid n=1 Tax=Frankliniella occidentalis associated qin-like virus1 TaxID=2771469 RepID=A0A7H1D346_9VIRU|nr:putative nucleocapsid [Frankliniella occidentalis associated qin-like virus1]